MCRCLVRGPGQQFPADFVDPLAGLVAFPVTDGTDDVAVYGDTEHLDFTGLVIGEVALVAVERLCVALGTAQMQLFLRGVEGAQEL